MPCPILFHGQYHCDTWISVAFQHVTSKSNPGFCGHGTPCPYRMCCKIARAVTKTIVQKRNDFRTVCPKRLLQLSAAGEVFLEGTCPLSRCPQTAKFPAPYFWRAEKVGEKSDSFSRAERTRPLRPVSRLQHCDLGNVPVERFQRNFPCYKNTGHGTICP